MLQGICEESENEEGMFGKADTSDDEAIQERDHDTEPDPELSDTD